MVPLTSSSTTVWGPRRRGFELAPLTACLTASALAVRVSVASPPRLRASRAYSLPPCKRPACKVRVSVASTPRRHRRGSELAPLTACLPASDRAVRVPYDSLPRLRASPAYSLPPCKRPGCKVPLASPPRPSLPRLRASPAYSLPPCKRPGCKVPLASPPRLRASPAHSLPPCKRPRCKGPLRFTAAASSYPR